MASWPASGTTRGTARGTMIGTAINLIAGRQQSKIKCDEHGNWIPAHSPPPARHDPTSTNWGSFDSKAHFELAEFYKEAQMPAFRIDKLLVLWGDHTASSNAGGKAPFVNHQDLYSAIDSTPVSDIPWQSFQLSYSGALPESREIPGWMEDKHEVWDTWAMFVPIILGSDKTTVSVGTGHNKYWPVYMSIGNIPNNAHTGSDAFRNFHHQLSHTCLAQMLKPLSKGFTTPEPMCCPDGHLRRTIYSAGPYIGDYPEQCMLMAIVQGWCPKCMAPHKDLEQDTISHTQKLVNELAEFHELSKLWAKFGIVGDIVPFTADITRADINELVSPDILHQLIKGTFKDDLVTWIEEIIRSMHPKKDADHILSEIDYQISLTAPFSGWTGDDSKALMRVYLAAIRGFVPNQVVHTLCAFIDFCNLAQHDIQDTDSLAKMDTVLAEFHKYPKIFIELGIHLDFNLPCQHSTRHWTKLIQEFVAPNGLCSSITEFKHIKAVKQPWHCLNHYKALQQMLYINQCLDKLLVAHINFVRRAVVIFYIIPLCISVL
ncbi:hypothetical protein FIBSPDRAFT_914310 [Athelia psychrophila]|uniref:CxC2-like cysteine cluster KDZ transposase-associated domain-containing protein n=1 Tax=Athelia psychrophila TaxID=1759441 RepID=A0A165X642_9AGAM|nr:hypothetical protein FIBSPDRAFT_914310 [Fibularhizoctonia sp. CBS 109695]